MDTQNIIKPIAFNEALETSNFTPKLENDTNTMELRNVAYKQIRDIFLDDSDSIEEAEIFYPSKMNEEPKPEPRKEVQAFLMPNLEDASTEEVLKESEPKPFIIANTIEVPLHHLKQDCIVPVFSKDNERTVAHQEFIDVVLNATQKVFPHHSITDPEIRVSHIVKGRTPEAIYKNAKDLLDHEKTIYYERMAFIIKIPSIKEVVNGNNLSLCIGGVRAYNQENLYNKKTLEKFKFFIGFQNQVCMNLCVWSDGFVEDMRVSNALELQSKALEVMQNYNADLHLMEMKELSQDYLTEHQFAQLIGKSRLYQHLPKSEKQKIPLLNFNDSHINTMAKDYYEDNNFCRLENGRINLWDVYNLFTQANKSSYIDTFLDRNLNAFEFSKGIQKTLNGNSDYHWFLS